MAWPRPNNKAAAINKTIDQPHHQFLSPFFCVIQSQENQKQKTYRVVCVRPRISWQARLAQWWRWHSLPPAISSPRQRAGRSFACRHCGKSSWKCCQTMYQSKWPLIRPKWSARPSWDPISPSMSFYQPPLLERKEKKRKYRHRDFPTVSEPLVADKGVPYQSKEGGRDKTNVCRRNVLMRWEPMMFSGRLYD